MIKQFTKNDKAAIAKWINERKGNDDPKIIDQVKAIIDTVIAKVIRHYWIIRKHSIM